MVSQPAKSKHEFHLRWRGTAVCLLTVLGIIALTGFMITHWIERQVLTTDNWVKTVGPLPQNDAVASALSSYSVNTLFTTADIESRISQALPSKASFLAPTLTQELQTGLTKQTKRIIQSSKFASIWQAANKAASQRLLASARGETVPTSKAPAKFNLDLSALKGSVGSLLGRNPGSTASGASLPAGTSNVSLAVNLKASLSRVKTYIKTVDFLNDTLWLGALVCLLGAIVITRARRRLVLIISLAIVTIALLQLIGIKAVRPAILNGVQNALYRPAAGVVYDTLLASFRHAATVAVIIGALLFLIAFFTRAAILNRDKTIAKWLKSFQKSTTLLRFRDLRVSIRRYRLQATIAVTLLGLALMAFIFNLDWQGIVRSVLLIILVIELINLTAARAGDVPMKQ